MQKNEFTHIDIMPLLNPLTPSEMLCLIGIEKTRCSCKVEGRKWISIMWELVDFKYARSLRDAFDFIKRLYGDKWSEVKFDYYNAIRGNENRMKYVDIAAEFDILLFEFMNAAIEKVDLFHRKD